MTEYVNLKLCLSSWLSLLIVVSFFIACGTETARNEESANQSFEELSASQAGIDFTNALIESDSVNIIKYLYFYNGGGVVLEDFVGDSLPDIFLTANQSPNKLYENLGNWQFRAVDDPVLEGQKGWASGATAVDINDDGRLDIYVSYVTGIGGFETHNELLLNLGDGHFEERSEHYGLNLSVQATQSSFFDADADGDLDVYILNQSSHSPDNYADTSQRKQVDLLAGDKFMLREGDRYLEATNDWGVRSSRLGYGLGLLTADFNNDGFTDVFISNDFHENDYLYLNIAGEYFKEVSSFAFSHHSTFSMGCDVGDINKDGKLDLVTLDMAPYQERVRRMSAGYERFAIYNLKRKFGYHHQLSRNMVHLSVGNLDDGTPVFREAAPRLFADASDWSWSPLLYDFTAEGDLDLYVTNGISRRPNDLDYLKTFSDQAILNGATSFQLAGLMPNGKVPNVFYDSLGSGTLQWGDSAWATTGAAYADMDGDGDVDIVTNSVGEPITLLKNSASSEHLVVHLIGPKSNRMGLGGTLLGYYENGKIEARAITYTRGFQSSSQLPLRFQREGLLSVKVMWPGGKISTKAAKDQSRLTLSFKDANDEAGERTLANRITIRELGVSTCSTKSFDQEPLRLLPSEPSPKLSLAYRLNQDKTLVFYENQENDNLVYTIISNLGLVDEEVSKRIIPQSEGIRSAQFHMLPFGKHEDPHLLSVPNSFSSFGQLQPSPIILYSISSTGDLIRKESIGDPKEAFASTTGDLNGDGYVDVIRATKPINSDPYASQVEIILMGPNGVVETISHTLLGNIKALEVFREDQNESSLAIAGQWMPISILQGDALQSSPVPIVNSGGFWQSLTALDINKDGVDELLAGNIGVQTRLRPSVNYPVQLYLKDFDRNGFEEPIVTYAREGVYWTFLGKDPIMERMPMLRKVFPDYKSFAYRPFDQLFPAPMLEGSRQLNVHTLKHVLLRQTNESWEVDILPEETQDQVVGEAHVLDNEHVMLAPTYVPTNPELGHMQTQSFMLLTSDLTKIRAEIPIDNRLGQLLSAKILSQHDTSITLGVLRLQCD